MYNKSGPGQTGNPQMQFLWDNLCQVMWAEESSYLRPLISNMQLRDWHMTAPIDILIWKRENGSHLSTPIQKSNWVHVGSSLIRSYFLEFISDGCAGCIFLPWELVKLRGQFDQVRPPHLLLVTSLPLPPLFFHEAESCGSWRPCRWTLKLNLHLLLYRSHSSVTMVMVASVVFQVPTSSNWLKPPTLQLGLQCAQEVAFWCRKAQ